MSLFLHRLLIPFLFLAAEADMPSNECYPEAVEVFHCNFDASSDTNFDSWPDGWTRRRGQGYPAYVKIQIEPADAPGNEQCLQVDLDGGGAAVFSPPIEVSASYSYVLEGMLSTDGLKSDRAYYSVIFLDAEKHPLVTFESVETVDTSGWKKICLGPISPPSRETKLAVIGLHIEPRGSEDLKGSAAFTAIRLGRLPRLELKTIQPYNLFVDPAKVEVACTASGFVHKNPDITFKLLDSFGRCLATDTRKLLEKPGDSGDDQQRDTAETSSENAGAVRWKPPIYGHGFYRVRAELHQQGTAVRSSELSLAVIEPRRAPARGEFGWSLPQGAHPIPLMQLNPLLSQAGINWVKYPLWDAAENDTILNQVLAFDELLNAEGMELVGLLNNPPEDLREKFGLARPLSAEDIFDADPKFWYPSLESVISRLAGLIRWWQLGSDTDASFSTSPEYFDKLAEIKKKLDRVAHDINLGISWDCRNALPSHPADNKLLLGFVNLLSQQPLSRKDLEAHLDANRDSPQKRWVVLKPLSKSSNSAEDRIRDLVSRMIDAKIHGADAIFCPDPFDLDCGLMNKDGTPGELFLPWRTTALELGGARLLGYMQLPHGSQNQIFARGKDAVMVVWNKKPVEEVLYLGENVKQIDLGGRAVTPDKRENDQVIRVDSLPTFVTGMSLPVTRWCMDTGFAQERMPSIFGNPQANGLHVKNPFPCEAVGTARIVAPRGWIVQPQQVALRLAAGEDSQQPFSLTFTDATVSGRHKVRVDFDIQADRHYKFSVIKYIEIGQGDVFIEILTRLNPNNELEVEQRLANESKEPVSFRCELFAPERRRLMVQVLDQGLGQNTHVFRLEDGKELIGKTLWLRATEIDGPRMFNYRFTVRDQMAEARE